MESIVMRQDFELLNWQEATPYLHDINHDFANIILDIEPSKEYKIIKAQYRFGEHIYDKGMLQIPYKNKLLPIDSMELPADIRSQFPADELLLTIPLNKACENYFDTGDAILPIQVFNACDINALCLILCSDDTSMQISKYWTISAGCKSLYLLPKISHDRSFKRLKKEFNLTADKPLQLYDQSNLFNQISEFQDEDDVWTADVLIFSKKWFDIGVDCFDKLRLYLLESAWEKSKFLRDYRYFKFSLSNAISDSNLNPNSYIKDLGWYH
jgi:hypothetical protein